MRLKHGKVASWKLSAAVLFLPPECRHPVHYGCEHDTEHAPAEPLQSRADSRAAADTAAPTQSGEQEGRSDG